MDELYVYTRNNTLKECQKARITAVPYVASWTQQVIYSNHLFYRDK